VIATTPNPSQAPGATPPPALSPRQSRLLNLYIKCKFSLLPFAAAARLSATDLAHFAADPDIQAHIAHLKKLATDSLYLRAAHAREVAIAELETLAQSSEDPIEKRRAASQLLRATSAALIGSRQPRTDEPADEPEDDTEPLPAPRFRPSPTFDIEKLHRELLYTLVCLVPDYSDRDGFRAEANATFAEFVDHDATINGEPIPTDTPRETFEAVEDSALSQVILAGNQCPNKRPFANQSGAHFSTILHTSGRGTEIDTVRIIDIDFTRDDDSRHPNCWLIARINIRPVPLGTKPADPDTCHMPALRAPADSEPGATDTDTG